jgi:hypothetical protein
MAASVPVASKEAAPLWVDDLLGVLPSVVRYGMLPGLAQVIVAAIGLDDASVPGAIVGAAAAGRVALGPTSTPGAVPL